MQDVLQFRLNLLTEIMSKTKDPNETNELAENSDGQPPKKDWHLDKEEAEKHVAMLKVDTQYFPNKLYFHLECIFGQVSFFDQSAE
jgi:hypothetical protein